MQQPEEIFEPYGPAVVAEVVRQLRRSGTLGPLLRQLNLPMPRGLQEQYAVLAAYVERHGAVAFLNEVSLSDPANVHLRRRGRVTAADTGADLRPPPGGPIAPGIPPLSLPTQATPPAPGEKAGRPVPSVQPASSGSKRWIEADTYVGPDRRSGKDRRRGPYDRREGLEVVYRNRRYGGWDRRKTVRREEDRQKKKS